MTIEQSHGKARPTLPRSSELAATASKPDRTAGRTAQGRFAPQHGLRHTRAWDRRIQTLLGSELEGEAGGLGRESHRWYRAFLAELPCLTDSVRAIVAQRARALALSGSYARRGAELGIGTPEGTGLLSEAAKWDQRAERLAVTCWDLATRAATAAQADDGDDLAARRRAFQRQLAEQARTAIPTTGEGT